MTELAHHSTDYSVVESEPPEVMARNLRLGAHLWASATAFFFIAFLFAYFYLRSLDNHGLWRPKHVDPSFALGTILTAVVVAAAGLMYLGLLDHRAGRRARWRVKGIAAIAALIAAIALQIVEWSTQGFGPTDGGYASVYLGWTGLYALFLVGLAYWLETVVATSIRYRSTASGSPAPGEASGDPGRAGHDIADPLSLVRPELEAVSFYGAFLALTGVVTWVILYLL